MSKGLVKKNRPPRKARNSDGLADLGLFNIPDLDLVDNEDDDSEVDESTLESELEALLSGKAPPRPSRPRPKVQAEVDIDQLAAACMVDPDEGEDEDDSNLEMDEDLLKELHSLATTTSTSDAHLESSNLEASDSSPEAAPSQPEPESIPVMLQERLNLYNEALKIAKSSNDNSKARRYGRAIKTLESLLKTAKAGGTVNEDDIPPIVNVPKKEVPLAIDAAPKPSVDVPPKSISEASSAETNHMTEPQNLISCIPNASTYEGLMNRRNEYRKAAVNAKKAGNKEIAIKYMKTAKTFDTVIEAMKSGQPVDLSNVPPPPSEYIDSSFLPPNEQMKTDDERQKSSAPSAIEVAALSAANEPEDPKMFDAPPPPSSVLEALQQRLEKYTSTKQAAETEGNKAKVRRLDRIIKLYETAIKNHKAGKPVDFEELPTPPGFAPIPVSISENLPNSASENKEKVPPKPVPVPSASTNPKPKPPDASENTAPTRKPKLQRTNTSTVEKQLEFLLERQKLFRQAAIEAKKNGDIQQAKEYLRKSKGFDSMIEATKCGLPIDASTIPTPPQLESDFVIVEVSECVEAIEGSDLEILETLEKDLLKQIEMCSKNKEHFLRYGDVLTASKFERSGLESRKDLSVVQHIKKIEGPVPRFHYETRLFSIVNFNDLADNDLKVTIERGINLPGKPDLDSYVRLEFPIPTEAVQKAKTQVIRGTNNPCFQEDFTFEFSRKSKTHLRQFKRHALKCEVFSKGGFLRSDTLLGTVNVKLVHLESICTIHDSFSLMDGRKACGGKLEIKIQIREPLLGKQVEEVSEKWLVIDR